MNYLRQQQQQQQQPQQRYLSQFDFPHNAGGGGPNPMQSVDDIRREQMEQQSRLENLLQDRMAAGAQSNLIQRVDSSGLRDEQPPVAAAAARPYSQHLFGTDHQHRLQMNDDRSSLQERLRLQAEEELRRRLQEHEEQQNPPTQDELPSSSTKLQHTGVSTTNEISSPSIPHSSSADDSHVLKKGDDVKPPAVKKIAKKPKATKSLPKKKGSDKKMKKSTQKFAAKGSPLEKKRPRPGADEPTAMSVKTKKRPRPDEEGPTAATQKTKRKYKKRQKKEEKPSKPTRPRGRPKGSTKKKPPPTSNLADGSAAKHDFKPGTDAHKKRGKAVNTLLDIKESVEWSDSENEDAGEKSSTAMSINLTNFHSSIPELPVEPEMELPKPTKKRIGLLDDDPDANKDADQSGKAKEAEQDKDLLDDDSAAEDPFANYPHPIDPWWPSLKKPKLPKRRDKANAKKLVVIGEEKRFKADLDAIKKSLSQDVQPGVLEKVPHCKIHRMRIKKMTKNPSSVPELVQCFQVTELYPNDMMVGCSQCGAWRHAACGGHHKPYSVREAMETPFVALCDRCHAEDTILKDHPVARKRLDRQRCEQIRRGLSTSATMRHASLSKYGGTYKWPLGSVSASHIGGHTRSVQARHDKAEKQWSDMVKKLAAGSSQRPKDRAKIRTKELERLLTSVEDAEAYTDRHNMMVFLMQDTLTATPVGYEKELLNMFDPEDDDQEFEEVEDKDNDEIEEDPGKGERGNDGDDDHQVENHGAENHEGGVKEDEEDKDDNVPLLESNDDNDGESAESLFATQQATETSGGDDGDDDDDVDSLEHDGSTSSTGTGEEATETETTSSCCQRQGCTNKLRFDSLFCSDACGVKVAETDLLRTLYYVSEIHPSVLRV
mmetsp:Transcript_12609/g.30520  ORF Transcript_12609/g.30520 Transcript_12609/m.30520 type:complete len:885 (-) Transcript_12609:951-3605(-)